MYWAAQELLSGRACNLEAAHVFYPPAKAQTVYTNDKKMYAEIIKSTQKVRCYLITWAWKKLNLSGHREKTIGRPISLDKKQQEDAPAVAVNTTRATPLKTPKRDPASKDINTVPGIIKVCINMQTRQYPTRTCMVQSLVQLSKLSLYKEKIIEISATPFLHLTMMS